MSIAGVPTHPTVVFAWPGAAEPATSCLPDLFTHAVTMAPVVTDPGTSENPFALALRFVKAKKHPLRGQWPLLPLLRHRLHADDDTVFAAFLEYLADLSAPWATLTQRYRDQLVRRLRDLIDDLDRLLRCPPLVALTLHRTDVATPHRLRIHALTSAPGAPPRTPRLHPTQGLPAAS